jgi:hypothetical protein
MCFVKINLFFIAVSWSLSTGMYQPGHHQKERTPWVKKLLWSERKSASIEELQRKGFFTLAWFRHGNRLQDDVGM